MAFTVMVPVKRHVRVYLHNHFGNPVELPKHHEVQSLLRCLLARKLLKNDVSPKEYPEHVKILISEHDFHHRGWLIGRTNAIIFNTYLSREIKKQLVLSINYYVNHAVSISNAVNAAREDMGLSEEDFSTDNLKKHYYRTRKKADNEYAIHRSA